MAARREKHWSRGPDAAAHRRQIALPEGLPIVPEAAGVFTLLDVAGLVLRIAGVPDLRHGVTDALAEGAEGP